jgi:hypothetical protein
VVNRSHYLCTLKKLLSLYLEIDEWLVGMNFTCGYIVVKNISTTKCERIFEYLLNVLQIPHLPLLLFIKSTWPLSQYSTDEDVKSLLYGGSSRAEEMACGYKWDILGDITVKLLVFKLLLRMIKHEVFVYIMRNLCFLSL